MSQAGSKPDTKQRILQIAGELFARQGYTATTIAALAGPDPDRATLIRANAALAVTKAGTLAALELGGGTLTAADRAEVLAVALRTLGN